MLGQYAERPLARALLMICFALLLFNQATSIRGQQTPEEDNAFITQAQVGHTSCGKQTAAATVFADA
jgi:hypothetical protein